MKLTEETTEIPSAQTLAHKQLLRRRSNMIDKMTREELSDLQQFEKNSLNPLWNPWKQSKMRDVKVQIDPADREWMKTFLKSPWQMVVSFF